MASNGGIKEFGFSSTNRYYFLSLLFFLFFFLFVLTAKESVIFMTMTCWRISIIMSIRNLLLFKIVLMWTITILTNKLESFARKTSTRFLYIFPLFDRKQIPIFSYFFSIVYQSFWTLTATKQRTLLSSNELRHIGIPFFFQILLFEL